METMAKRLKEALRLREIKTPALIESSGLGKGTVYLILDGTTRPEKVRAETVEKLCRALRIRREWLLWGNGPMDEGREPLRTTHTDLPDSAELRAAIALIAQALASTTPAAGREIVDALGELPPVLRDRPYLKALRDSIQGQLARLDLLTAPEPPSQESNSRKA